MNKNKILKKVENVVDVIFCSPTIFAAQVVSGVYTTCYNALSEFAKNESESLDELFETKKVNK